MPKRMTPEEAKAFVRQKAEEERARKKKRRLQWQPPTRREIEQRLNR